APPLAAAGAVGHTLAPMLQATPTSWGDRSPAQGRSDRLGGLHGRHQDRSNIRPLGTPRPCGCIFPGGLPATPVDSSRQSLLHFERRNTGFKVFEFYRFDSGL